MENEFMKRGYLLPEGCKDLSDVWASKARQYSVKDFLKALPAILPAKEGKAGGLSWLWPTEPPSIKGEIIVPPEISAMGLAKLLGRSTLEILLDLAELGVAEPGIKSFKSSPLDFEVVSKVARKYGFLAKKAQE